MALLSTGLCALFLIAVPVTLCVCALLYIGTRLRGDVAAGSAPGRRWVKRETGRAMRGTRR